MSFCDFLLVSNKYIAHLTLKGLRHHCEISPRSKYSCYRDDSFHCTFSFFSSTDSSVGAGIDSYYEYCLKAYILFGDENYLERFNRVRC